MFKKTEGKCSICGEISVLTFEHIPPKSAFNSQPKFIQGHEELFDSEGYKFGSRKRLSQGFGKHCLCAKCNNNTGNWYAKDYSEFAEQCLSNFRRQGTLKMNSNLKSNR